MPRVPVQKIPDFIRVWNDPRKAAGEEVQVKGSDRKNVTISHIRRRPAHSHSDTTCHTRLRSCSHIRAETQLETLNVVLPEGKGPRGQGINLPCLGENISKRFARFCNFALFIVGAIKLKPFGWSDAKTRKCG